MCHKIFASLFILYTAFTLPVFGAENDNWGSLITSENIIKFSPRASPILVSNLIESMGTLETAEINNKRRALHFLTQIFTETGGLRRLDENLMYSSKGLLTTFPERITPDIAKQLEYKPTEIANYIYGNRLGNQGRDTNDGWNYRGSGYIQLTGRYNFRMRGIETNLPLEKKPDLARVPKEAMLLSTAYWVANDINSAADQNNLKKVRIKVNGKKALGYEASKIWYFYLDRMLSASAESGIEAVPPENLKQLESNQATGVLRDLGFISPSSIETSPDAETVSKALKAYQRSRSLPETGSLDEDTLYSITDRTEWTSDESPDKDSEVKTGHPLSGISYNFKTKKLSTFATDSEPKKYQEKALITGTGIIANDTSISSVEQSTLKEIKPLYAPYEIPKSLQGHDDSFVPYSVIEPDTREVIVNTTVYPNRAVVQITFTKQENSQQYACSGAMISKNIVLTAGHCVYDEGTLDSWHKKMVIYPGKNGPLKPFGSCNAIELFALRGWVSPGNNEDSRLYDLGAIKLDCNVGNQTGWLALRLIDQNQVKEEIVIDGYPCDKTPNGKQWKSSGKINEIAAQKIFYQNDTYGCMSGSPVITPNDNAIIAVHTNGLHGSEPWASNNAATRISHDTMQSLKAWMEN